MCAHAIYGRATAVAALMLALVALIAVTYTAEPAYAEEVSAATLNPVATQVSSYKGVYDYTYGDLDSWGGRTPTKKPGYVLTLEILKKKGKKLTFRFSQAYFYGIGGFYRADSKKVTVKLKNRKSSFVFKTGCGDKGKGRIRLVSKKKVKLSLEIIKAGNERIPMTTGGKYKVLKKANPQYRFM